ncbi:NAD(P)H-dependent flavin oxidoreductase [Hwanghaeella sp.]|uniref:NAD(P)H-dependent flavin oxidoreductase n=1 Tax=Hwanghaeella sp. TaxID=2605943 RepID=UPI003CCBEA4D
MRSRLTELLDIDYPIIQAPMAGVSTPELAVAVANAGGLGSLAVGTMTAPQADAALADLKTRTNRPINVNVFTHETPKRDTALEAAWIEALRPYFAEFGAEPPAELSEIYTSFNDDPDMLEMLIRQRPAAVSFHFGLPRPEALDALKAAGILTLCSATTVEEARQVEAAGIDIVVAQGYEAGGHRGTFSADHDAAIGTFALIPQIRAAVRIPVVAAGGIGTGAGIAAAFALGADGVQIGTAFISTAESAAGQAHHDLLVGAPGQATEITSVLSGRPARGIVNRLMADMRGREAEVPAYPVAYDAGKALAGAAKAKGDGNFAALWGGQAAPLNRQLPAAKLIEKLVSEAGEALGQAIERLKP